MKISKKSVKVPPCIKCGHKATISYDSYVEISCVYCKRTVWSGMFQNKERALEEALKLWGKPL